MSPEQYMASLEEELGGSMHMDESSSDDGTKPKRIISKPLLGSTTKLIDWWQDTQLEDQITKKAISKLKKHAF